jgi:Zn finger protein HypA/HybF involved in hydrogenase expression
MHELALTCDIVESVEETAAGRQVLRVTLVIGKLAGVMTEAIRFCFPEVARGTALDGAALDIVEPEGRARCDECGAEFRHPRSADLLPLRLVRADAIAGRGADDQEHRNRGGRLMCAICGCNGEHALAHDHAHDHDHAHGHSNDHEYGHAHDHDHGPGHMPGHLVEFEARILAKNDGLAQKNRGWFAGREILALNLVSAPGAGKTTLIERTIADLNGEVPLFVIEGDQATTNDADRIRTTGAPVVQVNTGTGCHLDAEMVARGLAQLRPEPGAAVVIENVGDLVCPAPFDLGEHAKVVIFRSPKARTSRSNTRICSAPRAWSCRTRSTCCRIWISTCRGRSTICAWSTPRRQCCNYQRAPARG